MAAQGQRDLLIEITRAFEHFNIRFLLTGSFAVSYYGYPRATHDIDFIVTVDAQSLRYIPKAMLLLGKDYLWDKQEIHNLKPDHLFTLYHFETATKIDLWVTEEGDFDEKYQKRTRISVEKNTVCLVSAEDLILTKLLWCKEVMSERHMRDCAGMWHIQGAKLNTTYLKQKAENTGVSDLLEKLQYLPY